MLEVSRVFYVAISMTAVTRKSFGIRLLLSLDKATYLGVSFWTLV
jgi:hypothetical protein